jgi:N-acetyl-anhydromuramyl-L-alanine amidase AmpD
MESPNHNVGRGGRIPDMIVKHTSGSTTQSALNTVMNRANSVSYNFIIAGSNFAGHGIVPAYKDGDIFQLVDIANTAWHAGITAEVRNNAVFRNNAHPKVRERQHSPNQYTVGVAFGDMNNNGWRLTEAQIASAIWLDKHIQAEVKRLFGHTIPLTRENIIGHNEINPVNRPNCPGNIQWNFIMAGLESSSNTSNPQQPTKSVNLQIGGVMVSIPARNDRGRLILDLPEGPEGQPQPNVLLRIVLETMGFNASWDGYTNTVTATPRNE